MTTETFEKEILPLKHPVYRYALYMVKNKEDALDITQDVLVKLWEKRDILDKVENMRAWALKITRNKCLDLFKSPAGRTMQWNESADKNTIETPLSILANRDSVATIKSLMQLLPERQKEIFYLRHFEENSYKEIGESLDIDETKVKVYLHRARTFIKRALENKNAHGLKTG